jgi:hypothetical protein
MRLVFVAVFIKGKSDGKAFFQKRYSSVSAALVIIFPVKRKVI